MSVWTNHSPIEQCSKPLSKIPLSPSRKFHYPLLDYYNPQISPEYWDILGSIIPEIIISQGFSSRAPVLEPHRRHGPCKAPYGPRASWVDLYSLETLGNS